MDRSSDMLCELAEAIIGTMARTKIVNFFPLKLCGIP